MYSSNLSGALVFPIKAFVISCLLLSVTSLGISVTSTIVAGDIAFSSFIIIATIPLDPLLIAVIPSCINLILILGNPKAIYFTLLLIL